MNQIFTERPLSCTQRCSTAISPNEAPDHRPSRHHTEIARAIFEELHQHRLSTVAGADLVLVLDRGRLVEQGTHDQLLSAGGRYSELYRLQSDAYRLRPGIELLRTDPAAEAGKR